MTTELVTTLQRSATKIIRQLQKEQQPILITQRGLPAAYLIDVESFEAIQDRLAVLEGLARGEEAVRQGRVLSQAQAKAKMKRWFK